MFKHQVQPTHNSCVTTCLAILADRPAKEVVELYHDMYWDATYRLIHIFEELDIVAAPLTCINNTLYWGEVYVLVVPSLNIDKGTHQIILDMRDTQSAQLDVIDPAAGRIQLDGTPAKFYTELTVFDCNWIPEWRILDCPAMRK